MRTSPFRFARIAFVLTLVIFAYYWLFKWEVQYHPPDGSALAAPKDRAQFIRDAYIHGWNGYAKHAYPHDVLQPLSHGALDNRQGWGCTIVDALTASILLEVPEAVETALDHIPTIDWTISSFPGVAVFGSTIRYLGAMLSAYDLLTTTHKHLIPEDYTPKLKALLTQSEALASVLSPSFNTPLGINSNYLNFTDGALTKSGINDLTAISGLLLEWTHLSDLTGNQTYANLANKSMEPLLSPVPDPPSPYPGLLPKHLNITDGIFDTTDSGGWSHSGGGLYEMLLKNHVYAPSSESSALYLKMWIQAADSTIKHLASHPKGHPDLTFLADFNASTGELTYSQDHSGSFAAANFLLGGSVTGEKRFTDFGLALVESYVKLYQAMDTGIGPESIGWIPETCGTGQEKRREVCNVPRWYQKQVKSGFVEKKGFYVTNPRYYLRPEVLESLYYAYRITRDAKYRDLSWEIVQAVIRECEVGAGFAGLEDVDRGVKRRKWERGSNNGRLDNMPSFVLAETLMYAYIIQLEDDAPWQLKSSGPNEWVWTTEAHPLRVRAGLK
jgi:mannosyl-oligosaccharide alpha-1,2-mannosidase